MLVLLLEANKEKAGTETLFDSKFEYEYRVAEYEHEYA